MSNFFTWNESLNLGIEQMDNEHRNLVGLMDKIYQLNSDRPDYESLLDLLEKLCEATRIHFANEEKYMAEIDYPDLCEHKVIHDHLLETLNQYSRMFHHNFEYKLSDDFLRFLRFWLTAHIKGVDQKYGKFAHGEVPKVA